MRDDAIWLDEPEEHERRDARPLVVLTIATIPWLIVAGLILLPPSGRGGDGRNSQTAGTVEAPDQAASSGSAVESERSWDTPGAPTGADGRTEDRRETSLPISDAAFSEGTQRQTRIRNALAAKATVVARAWLTGVAPPLDVPGLSPTDPTAYAEHVVVEAIDRSDPDVAVVTVLAVLLRETPDGLRADTRRVAVPMAVDNDRARPMGSPWWLPSPDLASVELPGEAQTDPAWLEMAADGLRSAGLQDVEVISLERTDRWPWRMEIRARTSDGERVDGPVWMRWTGEAFVLAGLSGDHDAVRADSLDPPGPDGRSPEASASTSPDPVTSSEMDIEAEESAGSQPEVGP